MLGIVNQDKKNEKGETLYTLQINHHVLTQFYHKRSEGLSVCLEKAMKAAEGYEKAQREFTGVRWVRGVSDEAYKRLFKKAIEVFGDKKLGKKWMYSPAFGLNDGIPAEVAKTVPGANIVERLLSSFEKAIEVFRDETLNESLGMKH